MNIEHTWPALHRNEPLPPLLDYERGIWGKVHGAPTDFRWMARSGDFTRDGDDLQMQLSLGGEDAPERFVAWRSLGQHCYAVAGYMSGATDAAGRRGFLEKQILEWRRPDGVPSAVGALLLLPRAAALANERWWERYPADVWANPGTFVSLAGAEHEPLVVDAEQIDAAIERGREQLRESMPEAAVARLYEQLLAARRPSLLAGLSRPLPPAALAALLLPLPRELADRLSLAAWIPSTRPSLADLGGRWDVLVTAGAQPLEPAGSERATQMAKVLFSTNARSWSVSTAPSLPTPAPAVSLRPGLRFALTAPQRNDAPILAQLYEFAAAADRRWLAPEALRRTSRTPPPGATAVRLIASWIASLHKPDYADEKQWETKLDLLRSAAIMLVPEAATVDTVGLPMHVPALFYGLVFEKPRQWDSFATLGAPALQRVLMQSARCGAPQRCSQPLRHALIEWSNEPTRHDINVPGLISDALAEWPRP